MLYRVGSFLLCVTVSGNFKLFEEISLSSGTSTLVKYR